MKNKFKLEFLSERASLLYVLILVYFGAEVIINFVKFLKGEGKSSAVICYLVITILYICIFHFWIYRPYKRSEILVQRFTDGFMTSSSDFDNVFQSPAVKLQLEETEKILKSPKYAELNKRQAQYLALQNQINPHFLYNTLESIRGEALIEGLDGVADMTEALAKFFRYTITNVENLVSVDQELNNCETYFLIQKYRFGDRLHLAIDYDAQDYETIMSCQIPKLTLQPILENSIIHGTELKIGTGHIKIRFDLISDRLLIRISDDGIGMDEQTLTKLNRKLGKNGNNLANQEEQGGIALVNVNNRIHLIYGEEYGMHVYSVPNKGTDVEISLPINKVKGK